MRIGVALGFLVLASTVGAKDLVIRERASTFEGQMPEESTAYLTDGVVVTESGGVRTIVDFERKTVTAVRPGARTYTVQTFDEIRGQMDALRTLVEKLPAESRARLDAIFDDGGAVTVEPTGKTERIARLAAKEYAVHDGPYAGAVWTTDAIAAPAVFRKWKDLDRSRGGAARRLADAIEKVGGFPVRTRIAAKSGDQAIALASEVLDVHEGSPPPGLLEVPRGFTKETPGGVPPSGTP